MLWLQTNKSESGLVNLGGSLTRQVGFFCMQLWRSLLHECRLKGNSTLKISPKINIYDKWIYVSVIKLTMKIRYRRILTIKLLISANVFLHGGGSSKPSSLFLYLCLFVDVHVVTRNGCSYVISCVKKCVVSTVWQKIPQSFDPQLQPFLTRNAFINNRSSTVNGTIIYAWVTSFLTLYRWGA